MNATNSTGLEAAVLASGAAGCVVATLVFGACLWGACRWPGCDWLLLQWCLVRCCPRFMRHSDWRAALLEDIEDADNEERRLEEAAHAARQRLRAAQRLAEERGDDEDVMLDLCLKRDDYERALAQLPPDRQAVWRQATNKKGS